MHRRTEQNMEQKADKAQASVDSQMQMQGTAERKGAYGSSAQVYLSQSGEQKTKA